MHVVTARDGRRSSGSREPPRRRLLRPPATRTGRLALVLFGAALAGWLTSATAVAAGASGDSALTLRVVLLFIPGFGAFASALASGVAATVALLRGERSLLVAAPLLVGAFALMFVIGEVMVPH